MTVQKNGNIGRKSAVDELREFATLLQDRLAPDENGKFKDIIRRLENDNTLNLNLHPTDALTDNTANLAQVMDVFNWLRVGVMVIPDDFELGCTAIIDINQRFEEMTGCPRRELMRMSPLELFRFLDPEMNLRRTAIPGQYADVQLRKGGGRDLFCRLGVSAFKLGEIKVWLMLFRDNTDYREAMQSLKYSREKFQMMQDSAMIGVCSCDLRNDRIDCSDQFREMFDLPPETALSLDGELLRSRIHPDDYERYLQHLRDYNKDERFSFEFRIGPGGDFAKYICCSGMFFPDEDTPPGRLFMVFQDVSASRRMEMFVTIQKAISAAMVSSLSVDDLGVRLIDAGLLLDGIDMGAIYLFNPATAIYEIIAESGTDQVIIDKYRTVHENFFSQVIGIADAPCYLSSTDLQRLDALGFSNYGVFSSLAMIPVIYDRQPLGVIVYASKKMMSFPLFMRNLLDMLSVDIGMMFVRMVSQRALRSSEENYRSLVENLTDLVVRVDKKRRIMFVSQNCGRFFHCATEEMIGRDFLRFITRGQRRDIMEGLRQSLAVNHCMSFEQRVGGGDDERWLAWHCNAVYDSKTGEVSSFIGIGRDITENHNASRMLRDSEDRLRLILKAVSGCIWEWDIVNNVFLHDEKLYELLGYEIQDHKFSIFDLLRNSVHPEDKCRIESLFSELLKGKKDTLYCSCRFCRKDGVFIWGMIRTVMIRGPRNEAIRMVGSIEDVTDRKDFERIREQYLFLQKIIDALPLPIYYKNMQGVYIGFNRTAQESTYFAGTKLELGKNIFDFFKGENYALAEFIDVEEKRLIQNGGFTAFPVRIKVNDNEEADLVIHKSLIKNDAGQPECIVSAIIDVTDLKRTENALKVASQRLNTILNVMHEIIIWFDENMHVVWANHAAYEALGNNRFDDIIGMRCHELWFDREQSCDACIFSKVFESGRGGCETLRLANGKVFESWFYPVQTSGSDRGWVQLALDVTEQENARNEARLRQEQLIQADKMTSLGILVSGVAHEINNPNNFIVINISILKKAWENIMSLLKDYAQDRGEFNVAGVPYSRFSGMVTDLLEGIEEGSERIRVIVNDLKDYVRQTPVNLKGRFNVNDALSRAFMLCRNMLKRSSDNYRMIYGDNLPMVRGDVYRLEQVIINIVQNACQSLKSKESAIIVKTYYDEEHNEVVVEVSDEGVGIAPDQMKHIADPFFTTKRDIGGTGLGLSISKSIVEEHGGQLDIQSRPGLGTVVRVSLPPAGD